MRTTLECVPPLFLGFPWSRILEKDGALRFLGRRINSELKYSFTGRSNHNLLTVLLWSLVSRIYQRDTILSAVLRRVNLVLPSISGGQILTRLHLKCLPFLILDNLILVNSIQV